MEGSFPISPSISGRRMYEAFVLPPSLSVCVRSPAYSDISSSSQPDLLEQSLSPELLSTRADQWQVSSPEGSRDGRSYSPPMRDGAAAARFAIYGSTQGLDDQLFYQTAEIGKPEFVEKHRIFLHEKFHLGQYPNFRKDVPADSDTPYTDVAKPRKRVRGGHSIKRPMNAFMAFAQRERQAFMAVRGTVDNSGISSHLGSVWKGLKEEVKAAFRDYAAHLKKLHQMEFPGYKYRPQKRGKPDAGTSDSPATTVPEPPTKKAKTTKRSRGRKAKVEKDPPVTVKVEPVVLSRQPAVEQTLYRVGLLEQQEKQQPPALSPHLPPPGEPAAGETPLLPQASPFPEAEAAAAEGQPQAEPLACGLDPCLENDFWLNMDTTLLDLESFKSLESPSFSLDPDLDMNASFGPPGQSLVQGPEVLEALETGPSVDFVLLALNTDGLPLNPDV